MTGGEELDGLVGGAVDLAERNFGDAQAPGPKAVEVGGGGGGEGVTVGEAVVGVAVRDVCNGTAGMGVEPELAAGELEAALVAEGEDVEGQRKLLEIENHRDRNGRAESIRSFLRCCYAGAGARSPGGGEQEQ